MSRNLSQSFDKAFLFTEVTIELQLGVSGRFASAHRKVCDRQPRSGASRPPPVESEFRHFRFALSAPSAAISREAAKYVLPFPHHLFDHPMNVGKRSTKRANHLLETFAPLPLARKLLRNQWPGDRQLAQADPD